jgi:hypothetical protein
MKADGTRSYVLLWNVGWLSTDYTALYPSTFHNHRCENLKSYIARICQVMSTFFVEIRKKEHDRLQKIAYCQSLSVSMAPTVPVISAIVTFLAHVVAGNSLTAAQVWLVQCEQGETGGDTSFFVANIDKLKYMQNHSMKSNKLDSGYKLRGQVKEGWSCIN